MAHFAESGPQFSAQTLTLSAIVTSLSLSALIVLITLSQLNYANCFLYFLISICSLIPTAVLITIFDKVNRFILSFLHSFFNLSFSPIQYFIYSSYIILQLVFQFIRFFHIYMYNTPYLYFYQLQFINIHISYCILIQLS